MTGKVGMLGLVTDEEQARRLRAELRRSSWRLEALTDAPPRAPASLDERLEQLEQLRRVGCALAGIPYPEGPTPKEERRKWPVERIG